MLEVTGELGVPERDVLRRAALGELADDQPEGHQRFVDVDALLEPLTDRSRLIRALRSGQVDEVEVRHLDDPALAVVEALVVDGGGRLHDDAEDRVGPEMRRTRLELKSFPDLDEATVCQDN